MSKPVGVNPKDAIGSTKVSITKFPMVAIAHGANAMMDGARKYGPYNWRENAVIASIYIDAAFRHIMSWFEGEEVAQDSKVHHLGHAIACLAILLDAKATGNLVDDRPLLYQEHNGMSEVVDGEWLARLLDQMSQTIKDKLATNVKAKGNGKNRKGTKKPR